MKFKKRYFLLFLICFMFFGFSSLAYTSDELLNYNYSGNVPDGKLVLTRQSLDGASFSYLIYQVLEFSSNPNLCIINDPNSLSIDVGTYSNGSIVIANVPVISYKYFDPITNDITVMSSDGISSFPKVTYYKVNLVSSTLPIFNSVTDALSFFENGNVTYTNGGLPSDEDKLSTALLDNNIDYLHDVKFEHLMVTVDGNPSELKYIFHWGSDVRYIPDEWKVSLYIKSSAKVKGIFGLTNKGTIESSLIRVTDDYFKYNKLSFLHSELMENEEYSDFLALADSKAGAFGTYILSTDYYLRIEHHLPLMWSYGGWYRISPDGKDDGTVKKIDTTGIIDGSGTWVPDVDGGIGTGKTTEHSYGTGTTMEDAQANSAPLEIDETIFSDGILNGLKTMFNGLDDVSGFFNEVFTFLPREIGLIVTFIFSSIAILIIYKFIRG